MALSATVGILLGVASVSAAPELGPGWRRPDPDTLSQRYGVLWKADLGTFKLFATNGEEWARPLISTDGTWVFVGSHAGRLEARRLTNGELLWKKERAGAIGAEMAQVGRTLLVGVDSDLVGMHTTTGDEDWRVPLGGRIGGGIAIEGKIAVLPVRPNEVVAVDLVEHTVLWRVKRPTPDGLTIRGQATPLIDSARQVAYLGFSDGTAMAVRLDSGEQVWAAALGDQTEYFADVDASPVLVEEGNRLLWPAYNTGLFKLEAETGAIVWQLEAAKHLISLAPTPEGLIVASQGGGQVLAMEPEKGRVRWRYHTKSGAPTLPVMLPGPYLVVGSTEGPTSVLSRVDGRPVQLIDPGPGTSVAPAVLGHRMVIFSNGGLVLALAEHGGGWVIH